MLSPKHDKLVKLAANGLTGAVIFYGVFINEYTPPADLPPGVAPKTHCFSALQGWFWGGVHFAWAQIAGPNAALPVQRPTILPSKLPADTLGRRVDAPDAPPPQQPDK